MTRQKEVENSLRQFRERLALAMMSARLMWWELDSTNFSITYDEHFIGMFGYPIDVFKNVDDFLPLVHPDEFGLLKDTMEKLIAGNLEKYDVECRVLNLSGEYKWYYMIGYGVRGERQMPPYNITGVLMDIDARKIAEMKIKALLDEKELLLKEVHHRTKNNMTTINGLLSMQASTLKEAEAVKALEEAASRIQSMMMMYEGLNQSSQFSDMSVKDYIPALVDYIIANYANGSVIKVTQNIGDFILSSRTLQPVGLIVNELVTNIMKYAFVGRENGEIEISVALDGSNVSMIIQDNGNGIPESVDAATSTGFGLTLVETLAKQLKGSIKFERDNGTKFTLNFTK
jgi:two-component sensor histidine kinase